MGNSTFFIEHVRDIMRPAGHVSARAMFGGHGLYVDGLIVGIVVDDTLYLKCGERNRQAFDRAGLPPFEYRTQEGRRSVMSYRQVPHDALESAARLKPWVRGALDVALEAAAAQRRPRRLS